MGLDKITNVLREITGYANGLDAAQDEENRRIMGEERESLEPTNTAFPCPDILWQGVFAEVAQRLNKRTWEVWMGTLTALGAVAHRNLHWHYHRPLYGMVYGLLIAPTGAGKGLCADVSRSLLPTWYTVRNGVQSGPALAPVLAVIDRDKKGKIESITPRQAMIISEEFSTVLKIASIENSTLKDDLNTLFHLRGIWNISRSDRSGAGGDVVIENPTLSICGTTTVSLLREHVKERDIRSGFLNRYLVVPGTRSQWKFHDREAAGVDTNVLSDLLGYLAGHAWGNGQNVWGAYTPEAEDRLATWGGPAFEPIMNSESIESESLKRLHTYAHIIALLYAWSVKSTHATLEHVEAAIAVINVAKIFMGVLMGQETLQSLPITKRYELELNEKIIRKAEKSPGIFPRDIANSLRKTAPYKDVLLRIRSMVSDGQLTSKKEGKAERIYPLMQ